MDGVLKIEIVPFHVLEKSLNFSKSEHEPCLGTQNSDYLEQVYTY